MSDKFPLRYFSWAFPQHLFHSFIIFDFTPVLMTASLTVAGRTSSNPHQVRYSVRVICTQLFGQSETFHDMCWFYFTSFLILVFAVLASWHRALCRKNCHHLTRYFKSLTNEQPKTLDIRNLMTFNALKCYKRLPVWGSMVPFPLNLSRNFVHTIQNSFLMGFFSTSVY